MEREASARFRYSRPTAMLALLLTLLHISAGLKFNVPPGTSGGQVVINEGETLQLSCEDENSVTLSNPPLFLQEHDSLPEIFHRRTSDRWNSSITLRNVRPTYSGYYNCTSQANPQDKDSVYVYVKSKSSDRPWVLDWDSPRQKQMMTEFSAHLHSTATLDCRPNDPTKIVHLRDSKNRTLSVGRQPDGTELTWDPRVGFRLGPVDMRHTGDYWCGAQGSPRDMQLKLQVVGNELVAPMVWASRESPVPRGSDITLTCELALVLRVDFNLTWSTPTGHANEGYRVMTQGVSSDPRSWQRRTKMLYVFNVKDSDIGDYVCTALDSTGNKKSTTYRLQVQGAPVYDGTRTVSPSSASGPHGQHGNHDFHEAKSGGYKFYATSNIFVSVLFCIFVKFIPEKMLGFTRS